MQQDPVNKYALFADLPQGYQNAMKIPLLTAAEELELSDVSQRGGEAGRIARDTLVQRNLRLSFSIAREYAGCGVDLADLVQEGNEGLIKAAMKFKSKYKVRFSTYACWWVRQGMLKALAKQSRTIRLPQGVLVQVARMVKIEKQLTAALNRPPTDIELATALGYKYSELRDLRILKYGTVSLDDAPKGELPLGQLIAAPGDGGIEARTLAADLRRNLVRALGLLTERERTIIELRFGLAGGEGLTLEQIGQRLGVTRERIRQLQTRALGKLRGLWQFRLQGLLD
jgi:RNA polymerase primary sigma factor